MALADIVAFRAATASPTAVAVSRMSNPAGGNTEASFYSRWAQSGGTPDPGTAPTTAVVPVRTDPGALFHPGSTGRMVLTGAAATIGRVTTTPGSIQLMGGILIDRLSHQGGLVANVITSQTTNLPTAALTRNTDGVGVQIGLQVYTQLGSTDSVVTISYTNTADVAGRSATVRFVDTPGAGSFYWASLQAGDAGVKSVQSVQLSADTLTAGNFGIVLFKPLAVVGFQQGWVDATQIPGWNSQILDQAHLDFLFLRNNGGNDIGVVLQMSEV